MLRLLSSDFRLYSNYLKEKSALNYTLNLSLNKYLSYGGERWEQAKMVRDKRKTRFY